MQADSFQTKIRRFFLREGSPFAFVYISSGVLVMSKKKGQFVDNTFEPPDPRSDGRIPSVNEIDCGFKLIWGAEDQIEKINYIGKFEVIAVTKKHLIAKIIGESVCEEFDLRLIKQRNFVFVPQADRADPKPLFRSPSNREMLPMIARRVVELGIDLDAGEDLNNGRLH